MCPWQRLASNFRGKVPEFDQVPQRLQRHRPTSNVQWCCSRSLACCSLLALGRRCMRVSSAAGNRARAVPTARATRGARRA